MFPFNLFNAKHEAVQINFWRTKAVDLSPRVFTYTPIYFMPVLLVLKARLNKSMHPIKPYPQQPPLIQL